MTPEFRTWEDTERNLGTLDGVTYTACRKHNAILSHISKTFEWCSDLVWQKNVETPVNKLTWCELRENVLFHLGSFGIIWIMFAHVGSVPLNNINYVFVALSISGYLYADWHVIFWIPIGIQIEHFLSHNEFMLFCKHVSRLVSPAGTTATFSCYGVTQCCTFFGQVIVQISIIAKCLRCIDRQNCIWTSPWSYMARVNPHVQHRFTRVRSQGCRRRAQTYMMQLNVIGMQARCTCNWQQSDESNDHVYELLCITLFEIGFIKCHLLRPLVCMCLFATRATLQRKSNIFVENAMFVVHSSVPLRGHLHKMMTANIAQSADGASILSIQFCKFQLLWYSCWVGGILNSIETLQIWMEHVDPMVSQQIKLLTPRRMHVMTSGSRVYVSSGVSMFQVRMCFYTSAQKPQLWSVEH